MTEMRGPLSLGEISFYVIRAAVGVGVPWGLAEDLGRTATSMARSGKDPSHLIAEALSRLDTQASQSRLVFNEKEASPELTTEENCTLSSVYAAPAARDWMIEHGNSSNSNLRVSQLDTPELAVCIISALMPKTKRWIARISGADAVDVSQSVESDTKTVDPLENTRGILVNAKAWTIIQTYFSRCLVVSTMEARLTGAGAGVNDTD